MYRNPKLVHFKKKVCTQELTLTFWQAQMIKRLKNSTDQRDQKLLPV